jgi:hypothetical protein
VFTAGTPSAEALHSPSANGNDRATVRASAHTPTVRAAANWSR